MERFAPCPSSPNCVSSRAPKEDAPHHIEALPSVPKDRVKAVMAGLERCELVEEDGDYLHYVVKTRWLGFKDDVELEITPDAVHVRSASRVGYGDLGVNRKRVEALRRALT